MTETNARELNTSGFNRYMVECEYDRTLTCFGDFDVLIDTWWNVN